MNQDIVILGIESSCDDTSAAIIKNGWLLGQATASQEVHRIYGGFDTNGYSCFVWWCGA